MRSQTAVPTPADQSTTVVCLMGDHATVVLILFFFWESVLSLLGYIGKERAPITVDDV